MAAGIAKRVQLGTLCLYLIKIGGRMRGLLTRVKLHLASAYPAERLWRAPGEIVREQNPGQLSPVPKPRKQRLGLGSMSSVPLQSVAKGLTSTGSPAQHDGPHGASQDHDVQPH